jgi:hypothetical protein
VIKISAINPYGKIFSALRGTFSVERSKMFATGKEGRGEKLSI